MTEYRLFPSTNGPAAATSFGGTIIAGVIFAVEGGGNWLDGYWWWCCGTGQSTSPVKCALWCLSSSTSGTLVPGSVVTSGTLTPGAWNFIPLPSPIQLAPTLDPASSVNSGAYVAAIGSTGNFPDTSGEWSGDLSAGITNGPLTAFSNNSGTLKGPYSMGNGVLSTASADPSTTCPLTQNADNLWVDVQVSDTGPAGYNGGYRLWPNLPVPNPSIQLDDNQPYNVGTEVHLSQPCTAGAVWHYSPATAASLPTRCEIWDIPSHSSVAVITSPSWTLADGTTAGTAGAGWVRAAFTAGTVIPPGQYRVSAYNANGATGAGWNAKDASTGYWTTGAGSGGITNGPLSAPNWTSATPASVFAGSGVTNGQSVFTVGDLYPDESTGNSPNQNYFIDLEATPQASAGATGLLIAGGII